jgi:glycerophosphoryl diester phosphodiesterase
MAHFTSRSRCATIAGLATALLSTVSLDAQPLVIAHRGLSWAFPEHTLDAYAAARSVGADYLEQDLQLTADGRLLVLHDETGARTLRGTGCAGPVRALDAAHWATCNAVQWFVPRGTAAGVPVGGAAASTAPPLLEDVLRAFPGARFYIETKAPDQAPGMEARLVEVLTAAGLRAPNAVRARRVLLQSFSPASLATLARLAPELPRVQLLDRGGLGALDRDSAGVAAALDRIAAYAHGIGPSRLDITPTLVAMAHARCLVVHPYTANDPTEIARLLDAGVDGIFSDRPDVLRHAVAGRPAPTLPSTCAGR